MTIDTRGGFRCHQGNTLHNHLEEAVRLGLLTEEQKVQVMQQRNRDGVVRVQGREVERRHARPFAVATVPGQPDAGMVLT